MPTRCKSNERERLGKIVTNVKDLERWLLDNNNKQVGRGSEFRTVSKEMGYTMEQESNENGEKPKIAY